MDKFYITAAIPYVNAKPHIGHALEFVLTDSIARLHRLRGDQAASLSGGDENALKNVQAAEQEGVPIKQFVDKNSELFRQLAVALNAEFTFWEKGSEDHHFQGSQLLWTRCAESGDIYKKKYRGLYCLGCEAFYTEDELTEKGECFEHPGSKLQQVEEENYFFKLSKYQSQLIDLIESDTYRIVPIYRKNEILSFLKGGLQDISISRSNERARNWGVPVSDDSTQRMYVWFDALNIYQTGVGFGWNASEYDEWWPADLHVIGKGIVRFHAVYWPAFLLSAQLQLPKNLLVHGYYTVDGQKMSKTLGNVYDPVPLIRKYGADPLRYYFLAKTPLFQDGDFSEQKFKEAYNADLANGLGNLVARIAKLAEKINYEGKPGQSEIYPEIMSMLNDFRVDQALDLLWEKLRRFDHDINDAKPWKLNNADLEEFLNKMVPSIQDLAFNLQPFLPQTAARIQSQFTGPVKSQPPLFPRIT